MDGLMPIGEFSERSGLSLKRLRTYATEGLLVPAAVDPASGYRYYSSDQLAAASLIDTLRQAAVPLAEIRSFLSKPCEEQLETWTEQLKAEALNRRAALECARRLVVGIDGPTPTSATGNTKEVSVTTLHAASCTEKGPVRENNEDVVVISHRIAAIADGMGGHPGGETAAVTAGGILEAVFTGRSVDELPAAIRAANWAIWDRAAAHPELEGMGTTICAIGLLEDGRVSVANVGDSRVYLWHGGDLSQLTRDHSVTAELVERGELRAEDVKEHAHYGILTRALGVGPAVDIDSTTLSVEVGDRLLLCSDGLFNEVTDDEISEVMGESSDPISMAGELVKHAVEHGGRDNVSAVIVEVAA
jgi:PPM family protein phosphatase